MNNASDKALAPPEPPANVIHKPPWGAWLAWAAAVVIAGGLVLTFAIGFFVRFWRAWVEATP